MKLIKKTKIKKYNFKHRKQSKKQNGGNAKYIIQGSYGCIYQPPLKCKVGECIPFDENDKRCEYKNDTISKLLTEEHAKKDSENDVFLFAAIGYDNDFNYHIRPPIMCELDETTLEQSEKDKCTLFNKPGTDDPNHLLLYDYGGKDFFYTLYEGPVDELDPRFILGNYGLVNILEGIIELNKLNLSHCDLKDDNIVVGLPTPPLPPRTSLPPIQRKIRLIDFGLLSIINGNQNVNPLAQKNNNIDFYGLKVLSGNGSQNEENNHSYFFLNKKVHYPLCIFFLSCNISNENVEKRELWVKEIKRFVKYYMEELENGKLSHIHHDIRPFYNYLGLWDKNTLSMLMIGLFDILSSEEYAKYNDSIKLLIARNLDLYGWGVLLLKYANEVQSKILSGVIPPRNLSIYEKIPKKIYKFLKRTSILYPIPSSLIKKIIDSLKNKTKLELSSTDFVEVNVDHIKSEFNRVREKLLRVE